jgi:raffinose/stachyose/melibiose transport system permease protein
MERIAEEVEPVERSGRTSARLAAGRHGAGPGSRGRLSLRRLGGQAHLYMALPAFLLFSLFFLYPLGRSIGLSLTDWNGIGRPVFIGIRNFVAFFTDARALGDVKTTVFFALGSAPLLNLFGLLYALLLGEGFRGRGFARAVVYMPAVISPLIMGFLWYYLLQPYRGLLAGALAAAGMPVAVNWLARPGSALVVLVLVNVWQYVGITMVVYLAGLKSIPPEMYEASRLEGAGGGQTLRFVTLPLLAPAIRVNVVTNIIGSLSVFDVIVSLTDGGPGYATESLSLYILRMVYGSQTGYSTAVALILFAIILVPVVVSLRLMRRAQYEL